MVRAVAAALLLGAAPAVAAGTGLAGRGSVRLLPGWHLSWDDPFQENARAAGIPASYPKEGGPGGFLGFGYAASDEWEVEVNAYAAGQQYAVAGDRPLTVTAYGLTVNARWIPLISPGGELEGHLVLGMGPILANVTGLPEVHGEAVSTGMLGGAALAWKVADDWSLSLEYRYVLARAAAPAPVGGTVGAGGHFLLLGAAWHVAGQAPRRPSLEGF